MNYLDAFAILAAVLSIVAAVLGIAGWLAERAKPSPMARYQSRWPKTNGFRGY